MLCYLMRRLKDGNVMELGILRTMLKGPGGYGFADFSPAASLSVTQLEGRAGSITLKRETMSFGIVEEVNHRASERIREVLQTDGFGVSMLILIAQVRSRIVFESSSKGQKKPVKLIGNLYDSCQVVMSILLEFLTDAVDEKGGNGDIVESSAIARYAEFLPTLEELDSRYGFDAVSAWTLCRPLVRAANKAVAKQKQAKPTGGFQRRLSCFALTEDSRKSYQDMLPESTWSAISPRLFECFYTNSLHDLFCPETIYNGEITRVTKEIERIKQRQKGSALNSLQPAGAPPKNEDDELKRLEVVSTTLSSDLSKQKDHAISILTSMEANKSAFFPSEKASRHAANTFVTQCVFPRSMQSPDDALYCAHFISQLHKIETPGFSTLHYIDEFISVVSGALFGITEGEAAHLAILLWETWKVVNKWRYDEKAFDEEVAGKPGSYIESSSKLSSEDSSDEEIVPITYKDFAKLYNKWHSSLGAALIGCLQSVEYMHTRAGLLVLTRIVEVFPTRPKLGNELQAVLSPLQDESSSRLDIRASASAYGTMLLKARDDGKWVEEDASVAKARVEKERAAAQERKKKIAEQFQEMKRESEQITEEIGPRDGPRDRNDRRRLPPRDVGASRTPPPATNGTENGGPARGNKDERTTNRPPVIRPESGEVSGRDRRDHQERRGEPLSRPSPPREGGRGRDRGALEDRDRGRNESHGGSAGRPGDRPDARGRDGGSGDGEPHRVGRDEGRSLEGRWARGEKQTEGRSTGRTSKRSRPSSPEGGNDSGRADDRSSKRARTNQGPAGARDYDSRRDRVSPPPRRRGASPPRTPPPARPPPRSKRSRR
jgi:THO complex subunit 2